MKVLYLDTSSKYLTLAVADGAKVLCQMHRMLDRKHSTQLTFLIDKILKKAKVSLKKIDGFCVGKGPGSFTGLRIGITTVKGLSFVLKKPVVAIPSLDILVQNVRKLKKVDESSLQICPLIDAKQNKVYACLYQMQEAKIRRKSGYLLLPVDELLKKLTGKILFLGDAITLYQEKICQNKKIEPFFADEKFCYPRAAQAVPLALARFQQGRIEDTNSLVPLYLYPKECQIRKVVGRRW